MMQFFFCRLLLLLLLVSIGRPKSCRAFVVILAPPPRTSTTPFRLGHRTIRTTTEVGSSSKVTGRSSSQDVDVDVDDDDDDDEVIVVRSMRVRDIQQELKQRKVPTNGIFEKEELIQLLIKARKKKDENSKGTAAAGSSNTGGGSSSKKSSSSASNNSKNMLTTPLYFTSLDKDLRVACSVSGDGRGITVNPSEQPYATIQMQISNGNNGGDDNTLNLLLDTACSGFVLRPQVQERLKLPKLNTPVTMTGAGGGITTGSTTGLTRLDMVKVGGRTFGPNNMPAVIQDIGALPKTLDGILGLSFLNQFAYFELDFRNGQAHFFFDKNNQDDPNNNNDNDKIVTQGKMERLGSLGIFTTDVYLGERGPVSMLVDTGAACTLLNWKGVIQDLGLSKTNSPQLQKLSAFGAMGSDNVAIELTHRLHVGSTIRLSGTSSTSNDNNNKFPGLSLSDTGGRLAIDIGNIPVIDQLPNVGGILGIDALMRCGRVRISCRQEPFQITLLE